MLINFPTRGISLLASTNKIAMDFDQSTQATCWMFDRESLLQCKRKAVVVRSIGHKGQPSKIPVSKHACGFQQRKHNADLDTALSPLHLSVAAPDACVTMATVDQDILIHFHSHQIQRLIGPNAIFPELRRSASVLSTAIMLFRRFYLSNSVIDFHPRDIAAASALLAVKVDCERNIEVRCPGRLSSSCLSCGSFIRHG